MKKLYKAYKIIQKNLKFLFTYASTIFSKWLKNNIIRVIKNKNIITYVNKYLKKAFFQYPVIIHNNLVKNENISLMYRGVFNKNYKNTLQYAIKKHRYGALNPQFY